MGNGFVVSNTRIHIATGVMAIVALCLTLALGTPSFAWATVDDNADAPVDFVEALAEVYAAGVPAGAEGHATGAPEVAQSQEYEEPDDMAAQATGKVPCAIDVREYAGASMFETAAAEALAAFPKGSKSALIVGPGEAWIDALSAAGFAASTGPILFCEAGGLGEAARGAIVKLAVKSVYIIGGKASVPQKVEQELAKLKVKVEARLAGDNCIKTQMAIYGFGLEHDMWCDNAVFVATSTSFGDALSASPVAYAMRAPIFLADAKGALSADQRKAIAAISKKNPLAKMAVVGGTVSVSKASFDALKQAIQIERLSGDNQYETSAAIAKWAVQKQNFSWDNVAFATGTMPYDALAGSVLQGVAHAPLLVADDYECATVALVGEVAGEATDEAAGKAADEAADKAADAIKHLRFLGGKAALTVTTRFGVADVLGLPHAAMPGYKLYLDAGHGQGDLGDPDKYCEGAMSDGLVEAKLNAELANMVAKILREKYGVDVFLNDDGGAYWLRHAEAVALGCDELLSIHFNAVDDTGSLSLMGDHDTSPLSPTFLARMHPFLLAGTGLHDCGTRPQNVAILCGPLPAVLLEVCFIDVPSDMKTYFARKSIVAQKIAEGLVS